MSDVRGTQELINNAFLRFTKRAEAENRTKLVETFVDFGALATLLRSHDHQIIYGRRGTGKTHALIYLATEVALAGDTAVYVDLRQIGSNQSLYGDGSVPINERATRLLVDVLMHIHDTILNDICSRTKIDLDNFTLPLDRFHDAATSVQVIGTVSTEKSTTTSTVKQLKGGAEISVSKTPLSLSGSKGSASEAATNIKHSASGQEGIHIKFGRVGRSIQDVVDQFGGARCWILLDEWSSIPSDLQPILADLLRRTLFSCNLVTVKIGAIEQRSHFQIPSTGTDYIGIEVGADAAADLNLDDFMVFDNDATKAVEFFRELMFRHYRLIESDETSPAPYPKYSSSEGLAREAFTQVTAIQEFVRAAEGVPRDAINILSLAAQKAGKEAISTAHVRSAAQSWYLRDKEKAVAATPGALNLLHKIIQEVIGHRKARAFLLNSQVRAPAIEHLFDARVLHLLKRNISSPEQPGARYHVYKIDYGCYVDLLATTKAPMGLLPYDREDGTKSFVEVPPDDYRAIRRAILDVEQLAEQPS